ncbi:eIF-2B GDP-GTP exchange factor subunit epsilon [Citrus sinensis]|uniref:EIF-2B GDP-GTP exchange factor subunit epsilon n=1 Tax=Citrus sinensis TaxID=2711 RepID=A0ACB8HZT5_CITSI|nr:eIF-2B GDP-GTP exchange factor subunit epsilon [Citrus sinensis]
MGAQKKRAAAAAAAARVSEDPDDLARQPLQAILLADSFTTKFRPITLERPKVLLPLVNVPMINYTLAWLEAAGVAEVFVFCCAHSKQVIDYLENSEWFSQPNFTVKTIESHNIISAGDALRLIYEQNVIHGDFVLISGDTVSNMSLTQALQEHKERKKKDNNAVMTMIIKKSKPSPITRQSRLGTDELFMAIDPNTKQLLYYEDKADHSKGTICLDKMLLAENPSISLHNDKQDCYIDICSPEVLSLFTDNFDYQHLRRHFVKGLLLDDVGISFYMFFHHAISSTFIMGYKIFTHEIHSSYAARIDNYRSYDIVSKDIIQRWTYPYVPDVKFCGNRATKLERRGICFTAFNSEIEQSRSAQVGSFTVIGYGTKIGSNSKISDSVIGEGCTIGSNVLIEGSYIWDNVIIEDGCELRHVIVCDGVIMKAGAVLKPGVVLSFKVVIGERFVVPAYSKVSLLQQPTVHDSDEELEYADNSSGTVEFSSIQGTADQSNGEMTSESSEAHKPKLGTGGVGYIWSICEGGQEEEWRHSVAPIPEDKLTELSEAMDDDQELVTQDRTALSTSGELISDSNASEGDDNEDSKDDSVYFEKEVEATFLRAVEENVKVDHVILEVNSLRLSYNMTSADCAGAVFYSMMKLAIKTPHSSAIGLLTLYPSPFSMVASNAYPIYLSGELQQNTANIITTWQKLLKSYLLEIDEEIEIILKFEEMCLESAKEFSPLFARILHILYDKDILQEDAILRWADEKEGADESDKVFVRQSEKFIQWLREASEEED